MVLLQFSHFFLPFIPLCSVPAPPPQECQLLDKGRFYLEKSAEDRGMCNNKRATSWRRCSRQKPVCVKQQKLDT